MSNNYEPPLSNVADVHRSSAGGITDTMLDAMRGTKPWVLLIGIVLIVMAVFMIIGTFGIFIASTMGPAALGTETAPLIGIGAMYAVMSIIYIMLGIYLFKYSSAIGRLLQSSSVTDMEVALKSQRSFWKLSGVITAIMIVVMILGFVAAIALPFLGMTI